MVAQAWLSFQYKTPLSSKNPYLGLCSSSDALQKNALQHLDFFTGLFSSPHHFDFS
jgi:hypothetical protein